MSQEDKSSRKSLKTVQRVSSDIENLGGRPAKSLRHQLSQESPVALEVKKKNVASKEIQVNIDTEITVDDLTNPKDASKAYWKRLAKNNQFALQKALDENEKLHKHIEDLKSEILELKQMLEEANSFVEVIKEELAKNDNDDTGIDVNDVSTADETLDNPEDAAAKPTSSKDN